MSSLTDVRTLSSLLSDAANTFKSSMYKRSVISRLIGFDNLYLLVVLRFQAIGFRHKVKSLRQNELSCCNPLWKIMISDVSFPYLVSTTILVFQLLLNCRISTPNHRGNRWNSYISPNHLWFIVSKAFLTSTQAILRFRFPLRLSWHTIRSIRRLSTVPLHFSTSLLSLHQAILLRVMIYLF